MQMNNEEDVLVYTDSNEEEIVEVASTKKFMYWYILIQMKKKLWRWHQRKSLLLLVKKYARVVQLLWAMLVSAVRTVARFFPSVSQAFHFPHFQVPLVKNSF